MKEKMSRSKIKVYIVLHLLLFLYAAGGICSKLAAKEAFLSPKFIMYYMIVLANLAFYAIVWQQIIKRISLVSAFANKAITVVWGMMWGFLIFGESITITKIIGAVIIIVGIYFVVSDKSNIVICNKCKTPIVGFREERDGKMFSRYRCNCQFMSANDTDREKDNREFDCYVQAFDGESKFTYRRIYNVSVCDSVVLEGNAESDQKLLFKLHYDPYKLLHVAYQNRTYAKYRISELNLLKRLFECQKGIPVIYLDYFVTSNPIHIKIKMLEEYLEHKYKHSKIIGPLEAGKKWKKPFIENIMREDSADKIFVKGIFEKFLNEKAAKVCAYLEPIEGKFVHDLKCNHSKNEGRYKQKVKKYLDMAMKFYSKLLVYQWLNEYLNNYRNESFSGLRQKEFGQCKCMLLSSEWKFASKYFSTPELRCMIEDCFLQFTRMYLDISDCAFFPDEYYEQYENGEREKIFQCTYINTMGKKITRDIARDKRYFNESKEYYYKALVRYLDAELYRPINMMRKDGDHEIDVVKEKIVDAYTDLYLFYLFDQEMSRR